ncbi:hypothetical protein COV19_02425 [Candidatus Woesearchaeota archaeon CG10_big_fil_rev_8_21_14_0_10_44_13]|nr:MAG: hypothetical protein COV19_02425 [Candidatus Woesearchaeota archaeon CG10_big_fil_rev_8_21_14_0_10_44_13]
MSTIKKIGMMAIGVYIALINAIPAKAADATVEIVSGADANSNVSTTIDTKLSGEIAKRANFFLRNRTTLDDSRMVGSFTSVDLSYALGKGFDAVAETQYVPGSELDARLGIQYFREAGKNLTAYALITRNFSENPNTEFTGVLGYTKGIGGKWKLAGRMEEVVNMTDNSYNYDLTRMRLGIGRGKFTIGPAADISGIGSGKRPTYVLGGFASVKF